LASGEPIDELRDLLERVGCGGLRPAGEIRNGGGAGVEADEGDGDVRDRLRDELFGGVVQLRIVVLTVDADECVRELVTDDVDLRVDRLP